MMTFAVAEHSFHHCWNPDMSIHNFPANFRVCICFCYIKSKVCSLSLSPRPSPFVSSHSASCALQSSYSYWCCQVDLDSVCVFSGRYDKSNSSTMHKPVFFPEAGCWLEFTCQTCNLWQRLRLQTCEVKDTPTQAKLIQMARSFAREFAPNLGHSHMKTKTGNDGHT